MVSVPVLYPRLTVVIAGVKSQYGHALKLTEKAFSQLERLSLCRRAATEIAQHDTSKEPGA